MNISIRSIIFRTLDRRTPGGKIRRAYRIVAEHQKKLAADAPFGCVYIPPPAHGKLLIATAPPGCQIVGDYRDYTPSGRAGR